jgi:secreted PhoX family phosphatase
MSKHIQDLIASRRSLLQGLAGLPLLSLAGCATASETAAASGDLSFTSVPATNADSVTLPPGYQFEKLIAWGDALFDTVSPRFDPDTLTRAEQEQRFGQNNDMLALFSAEYSFPSASDAERLILCANNEYFTPELTFPSLARADDFTPAHVEACYASMGVSVVEVEKSRTAWRALRNSAPGANSVSGGKNRRITPFSPVLFSGPAAQHPWIQAGGAVFNRREPARGAETAHEVRCGTLGNCAGGLTPWGTYLTAEENFDTYFPGSDNSPSQRTAREDAAYGLDAASFGYPGGGALLRRAAPEQFKLDNNPHGPALYGWVVEIDPYNPAALPKKRTALGRKKNECATSALTRDGRVAIYMGDDQRNEFVYKFVSRGRFDPANRAANMDLLDDGDLYVAQFQESGAGQWLKLTLEAANAAATAKEYPARFVDEADLLVRGREAARIMDATPMDRPEDIEALIDANWVGLGAVLIVCTNNSDQGFDHPGNPRRESARPGRSQSNLAGHILKLQEAGEDSGAEQFTWDVFALAGDPNAADLTAPVRGGGAEAHISTKINGSSTFTGDRFACPDNLCIDKNYNVWIATDGSDAVFADCNDQILATSARGIGPRVVKRFLVGPVGSEICGPLMAPDGRAFLCAIQHPGGSDIDGSDYASARWGGARPPSSFPDGDASWPRSSVIVITRADGNLIGL